MPTLFNKGNLKYVPGGLKQDQLDEIKPLDYIMQWFETRLNKTSNTSDRILILLSETGSGKSTVLPPTFYKLFFEKTSRRNIACTQPRILTALQIPKEVEKFNPELKLGESLGYQTSILAKKPTRGVIYMTTGTLQQQLNVMSDEDFMNKYSIIFLDEIHERSIPMDFTLFAMKRFIQRNYKDPRCPFLVVMSATFDVEKFQNYLLSDSLDRKNSSLIKVAGLTFPIDVHWPDHDSNDVFKDASNTAVKIHIENTEDYKNTKTDSDTLKLQEIKQKEIQHKQKFRDILIFVGGLLEAKNVLKHLNSELKKLAQENKPLFKPLVILGEDVRQNSPTYQELEKPIKEIRVEISGIKKPMSVVRRVFISTNVAETGITINTLKYVIDTGYFKSAENNPNYNMEILAVQPVTHGMWKQRKGRAGRKAPGKAYPLYSESTYKLLQVDQHPDIVRQNITLELLMLLCAESDPNREFTQEIPRKLLFSQEYLKKLNSAKIDLNKLDLLDIPSADSLHFSMDTLYRLGAISKNCKVKPLGILISRFRQIPIGFVKMILSGWAWDAPILDLINITALANSNIYATRNKPRNILKWPWHKEANEHTHKLVNIQTMCEFIEYAIIWNFIENSVQNLSLKKFREIMDLHKLSISGFQNAMEIREDLIRTCLSIGLNPYKKTNNLTEQIPETIKTWIYKIKICIWEGFKTNLLIFNEKTNNYENTRGKISIKLDNLFHTYPCKYIVYSQITWLRNMMKNSYVNKSHPVSVMDGFVNFHENWDIII